MLAGYPYRKVITIDQTKIDAALVDFPIPVLLTAANFSFGAARSDGFDIRFTSSDGDTLLKYERVSHDAVGMTAEYWVKVPAVSDSVDTVIYMYYGKADATDGADPENVWDANFKMVQHMNDGADTSHITDSTANNNDGTKTAANEPVEAAGKIGKGQMFDGGDDYISTALDMLTGAPLTISVWVNPTSLAGNYHWVVSQDDGGYDWGLLHHADTWRMAAGNGFRAFDSVVYEVFAHVCGVWEPGVGIRFFLNGIKTTDTAPAASTSANSVWLGRSPSSAVEIFQGLIDEVRISLVARSDAWIKAEYNAGNGTLITMVDDWTGFTQRERWFLVSLLPQAIGGFTRQETQHLLGIYPGLNPRITVGGNLTFNGVLGRMTQRGVGGNLTFNGALGRMTQRGLGGLLTFNGALTLAQITTQGVGGLLTFNGSLQALNPDWLLIPDYLNWRGLWDAGTTYDIGDAVLYVEGDRHFAFASKAGSNLNHAPSNITWWYRLNPEPWGKV